MPSSVTVFVRSASKNITLILMLIEKSESVLLSASQEYRGFEYLLYLSGVSPLKITAISIVYGKTILPQYV
jgi:hypothetical protein